MKSEYSQNPAACLPKQNPNEGEGTADGNGVSVATSTTVMPFIHIHAPKIFWEKIFGKGNLGWAALRRDHGEDEGGGGGWR